MKTAVTSLLCSSLLMMSMSALGQTLEFNQDWRDSFDLSQAKGGKYRGVGVYALDDKIIIEITQSSASKHIFENYKFDEEKTETFPGVQTNTETIRRSNIIECKKAVSKVLGGVMGNTDYQCLIKLDINPKKDDE